MKLAGLASARLVLSAFAALMIPVPGQGQVWRSTLYPENWQRPPVTASFYDDKLIQDFSYAGTSGNVFLLCEDRETARATGSSGSCTTSGSGSDNHMHFSHSNLWDRCHAYNSFWTAHHRTTSGTVPHGLTSAHAVYWNTTGSGTRYTDIVRSGQGRYGYVIGTSGSRSGATNPTTGNTAPADHLEGIGLGATLEPASLYLDQLSRRTVPKLILTGQPVRFPENTFTVGAAITLDGQPVAASVTLDWELVSMPPGARHVSSATADGRTFTVSRPGIYVVGATGITGEHPVSGTVEVEVLPPAAGARFIDLFPVADSHVRGAWTPNRRTTERHRNYRSRMSARSTSIARDSCASISGASRWRRFKMPRSIFISPPATPRPRAALRWSRIRPTGGS